MSNDALVSQYERASTTASHVARQLAFAGVGIVWLFSGVDPSKDRSWSIPEALQWAGLALAISLTLDLIHAVYRTVSFALMLRLAENRGDPPSPELDLPRWMHLPSNIFFYGKLAFLLAAYVFIVWHLAHQVF